MSQDVFGFVPVMLNLYWLLAAGAAAAALLPFTPDAFRQAVQLSASRGKTWESRPLRGLGAATDWTTPQSWFSHFYLLGLVATAAVAYLYLGSCPTGTTCQATTTAALMLLTVHLSRRALETVFMMKYPVTARMHAIAYIFGLSYYVALPMSVVESACYHGRPLAASRQTDRTAAPALTSLTWTAMMGMIVFLVGNVLQFQAHSQLAALHTKGLKQRQSASPAGGSSSTARASLQPEPSMRHRAAPAADAGQHTLQKTAVPPAAADAGHDYVIPTGGLFELVSCPHYLAEIIIYLGLLAVIGPYSWRPWLILTWLVSNLLLAAEATHKWYLAHFPDYPRQRRALVPFLR